MLKDQGAVAQPEERRSEDPKAEGSTPSRTTKPCKECGSSKRLEEFNRSERSRDGKQPLCKECDRQGAKKRRSERARKCKECSLPFSSKDRHATCGKCRRAQMKVPCPLCGVPKSRQSSTCSSCKDRTGANNPNWRGGYILHSKGYLMVRVVERGYVMAHTLIMEEQLGRRLTANENVHHINGVRDDNRVENLELWSSSQPSGQRVVDKIKWAKEILDLYEGM